MKRFFLFSVLASLLIVACNKERNAYPVVANFGLDPLLYPGNFSDYNFPTFSENTNTQRNVLIEDFTGHKCTFCPAAADTAHYIKELYPERVMISTVHSDPTGEVVTGSFQSTSIPNFEYDFTNAVGLQIGGFYGSLPGNGFFGNPSGNVSRVPNSSGKISFEKVEWRNATNQILLANDLKMNIQSVVNYFPSTRGAFIHIEVDEKETIANELRLVVAFMEDSIVKPQKLADNSTDYNYVHRDLLKAHINGEMNGQAITTANQDPNGKYYFNYSYKIPTIYNPDNCHLLIYVMDMQTKEIYQVIKKDFM